MPIHGKPLPAESNDKAKNTKTRIRLANTVLLIVAIIGIVRSCIHLFSPDGGASSIAGLNTDVAGGDGIIFAFALWGGAQLLLAFVQIMVYFKARNLVPLMYMFLIVEILLRMLAGWLHPVSFTHIPPGAVGNYVVLAVAIGMLVLLELPVNKNPHGEQDPSINDA